MIIYKDPTTNITVNGERWKYFVSCEDQDPLFYAILFFPFGVSYPGFFFFHVSLYYERFSHSFTTSLQTQLLIPTQPSMLTQ